jgi:pimeloyl-ACP methyl ester carboxylesterase
MAGQRGIMKSLKPAVVMIAALAGATAQAQQELSFDELRATLVPYASPDAVTLPDGRQLAFVCMGEGSPTVILTSGLGAPAWTWSPVQSDIAKTTRVCAWDRPGWGLSEGSATPQNVATTTADLEAALATGEIAGPYVVVGHSLGASESLLFADRRPEQTVGMVLVDPSIPDQDARRERVAPGLAQPNLDQIAGLLRSCAEQIRRGSLQVGGPDPDNCLTFGFAPFFPDALNEALTANLLASPLQYETQASFALTRPESSRIVVNLQRNYRDMPLIVLTATVSAPTAPDSTPEQLAAYAAWTDEWNRGHDELAALSTRGINARVPGANHNIHNTRRQVVIDAVEAVVAEAREAAR